tara:strand:+ start:179 stop:1933 length:1755 start_codon:yes stop_codon:yes gene_type:complete
MINAPFMRRATVPGTTGVQPYNVNSATDPFEGAQEGLEKISSKLSAAGERVQNREDVINRGRDENTFKTNVSTEWQRVQDQEDLTNQATFQKFNSYVESQKATLLNNHYGGPNSSTLLESGLSDLAGGYERAAISATREAQIGDLTRQFGEKANVLISGVASGEMDINEAVVKIKEFTDGPHTLGSALPTSTELQLVDALQSQLIILAVNQKLDGTEKGVEAAKALLDQNPSFEGVLSSDQLGKVVKKINDQETAINIADIKMVQDRQNIAKKLGYDNYNQIPAHIKIAHTLGTPLPGPYKMQTSAGKTAADRANLVAQAGGDPNNLALLAFDKQINLAEDAKRLAGAPEIVKMYAELNKLEAEANPKNIPMINALKEQINQKSPSFILQQERVEKFPKAVASYDAFLKKSELQIRDAQKALFLITGEEDIEAAKKAITKKEFKIQGLTSKIGLLRPGSPVIELKELLTAVGGRVFLDTFQEMKMNSPTGSAGMGALSDIEGEKITFSKGALNWEAPEATANTLVGIIEGMQSVRASQRKALSLAFPTLGKDYVSPDNETVGKRDGSVVVDRPLYDLEGKGVGG